MLRFGFLATAFMALFLTTQAAQASSLDVDFSSPFGGVWMDDLKVGQSGDIVTHSLRPDGFFSGETQMGYAVGELGSNLRLTFTYVSNTPMTFTNNTAIKATAGYAGINSNGLNWGDVDLYDYMSAGKKDKYEAQSGVNFTPDATALLTATAHFIDDYHATLEITNRSGFTAGFLAYLTKAGFSNKDLVSYSITAVPLPAALPLFGAALVGLAGYRRRKQNA